MKFNPARRLRLAWLAFAALPGLAACERHKPRVILITVDTLRADHVRPDLTPSLAALGRDSVVFSDAVTNATTTLPSHASMLSGMLPWRHRVVENTGRVESSTRMVPEEARAAGFRTGAVISSFPLRGDDSGMRRGFDDYDDTFDSHEENRRGQLVKSPEETTRRALAWAKEHAGEKFFLWVHYFPPHGPYAAPARFLDPSEKASGETLPVSKVNYEAGAIPAYQKLDILPDAGLYKSRYAAQVRHVDFELGRLLDGLRDLGLYDDAVIVLASDHGESLGEHNHYFCHGDLVYDEQARIPLFVKPRGTAGQGRADARPAQAADIGATLLAALGRKPGSAIDGLDLLGPLPAARPRFTASTAAEVVSIREDARLFTLRLGAPALLSADHPPMELFLTAEDQRAGRNRIAQEAALGAVLERAVRERFGAMPQSRKLSPEVEERMKSLGYIR